MDTPAKYTQVAQHPRVCRLGLATRGDSALTVGDVLAAVDAGVNYLNWPGVEYDDAIPQAVRSMGARREEIVVATQISARTKRDAEEELARVLALLDSSYIDVLTYYYVEKEEEWQEIIDSDGAAAVLLQAKKDGIVRSIGVTTHQRNLAAELALSGHIDLLMVRYNAAHRGAEHEVFPAATREGKAVVAFTATRWGGLLNPSPHHPSPTPSEAYRFVLMNPNVDVCLMAPANGEELAENLAIVQSWQALDEESCARMRAHGDYIRAHGGAFP